MTFDEILAAVQTGEACDFNPDTNPVLLTTTYSRGPQPGGRLMSIKSTLKDRELDPTTQPHVVFVIDESGSMQGSNIQAAINVFRAVYDAVDANTHISIILFNNETETLNIPLLMGTTAVRALKSQIDKAALDGLLARKRPEGGTNIIGALKATAAVISQGADVKPTTAQIDDTSVIFITDGDDNGFAQYASILGEAPVVATPPTASATAVGAIPSPTAGDPPKPSTEEMLRVLKNEMEKDYGIKHFPCIRPIGIGVRYNAQLVMSLGDDPDFHRTGFLHIAYPHEVAAQRSALAATVDPVRLKTQLFIAYKDGTHQLYPDIYLQRGVEATKEYLLDSLAIREIYLVQERDATHREITRIVSEMPAIERLPYSDELLERFLIVESAGITNSHSKCDDPARFPMFLEKIATLLSYYPKDYWRKNPACLQAIENLSQLHIKISDEIEGRPPARVMPALGVQSFFHHGVDSRDSFLRTASAFARTTSTALSPGEIALSPNPGFSYRR